MRPVLDPTLILHAYLPCCLPLGCTGCWGCSPRERHEIDRTRTGTSQRKDESSLSIVLSKHRQLFGKPMVRLNYNFCSCQNERRAEKNRSYLGVRLLGIPSQRKKSSDPDQTFPPGRCSVPPTLCTPRLAGGASRESPSAPARARSGKNINNIHAVPVDGFDAGLLHPR